jgi:hypothetical protein
MKNPTKARRVPGDRGGDRLLVTGNAGNDRRPRDPMPIELGEFQRSASATGGPGGSHPSRVEITAA